MIERFGGESVHTVDAKGRVSVPASFRPILRACHPGLDADDQPRVVLVHGMVHENCIQAYTLEGAERIGKILDKMPKFAPKTRALRKKFFGQSVSLDLDPNGRIILPKTLREKAGIAGKAVFVGDSDTFEIWSPEGYDVATAQTDEFIDGEDDPYAEFHAIAEALDQ